MNTTEFKALAEQATPGPWLFRAKCGTFRRQPPPDSGYAYGDPFILATDCDLEFQNEADLDFILTCSPERILALLRVVEAVIADRAQYTGESMADWTDEQKIASEREGERLDNELCAALSAMEEA